MNKIVNDFFYKCLPIEEIQNEKTLNLLKDNLEEILSKYDISEKSRDLVVTDTDNQKALTMFLVSKKVEGASEKSSAYYALIIKRFIIMMNKPLTEMTTNDIRMYLAIRKTARNSQGKLVSSTTLDNELRILKSLFKWLATEDYIQKNITLGIKAIKKEKRVKKPFTEMEIEKLRTACKTKREKAIIEFLLSTAARVGEVENLEKSAIENDTCLIYGKGSKERYAFLNAKALFSINEYLNERKDDSKFLFVTQKKPVRPVSGQAIEIMIRELGKRAGVTNCHPHRFRRTTATNALNRGMPIEQVSQMLGHVNLETTTIYARSEMENVKNSHKKYVI